MKNLIFINGTMGVGKTETSRKLQNLLPNCVFLDGDWCWDAVPFIVNDETKAMVLKNITSLLTSFLACSAYENVLFCWVMHEQEIMDDLLTGLNTTGCAVHKFSLVCSAAALLNRLTADIKSGRRQPDIRERSIARLQNYHNMDTEKIDTSALTATEAAQKIYRRLYALDE